jgi:DNA-binding PadR family transcriptional regulator
MPKDAAATLLPLTPAVLYILLSLTEGPRHGYAIAQDVETASDGQVRMGPGTLYGSIQRMQAAGLLDDAAAPSRASSDDERRKYYRTTALGRRALELELHRLGRVIALARRKHLLRPSSAT